MPTLIYRTTMTAIAKGEVLGVREEGMRLQEFVERRYWPGVKATLVPVWADRFWDILSRVLLPRLGTTKLAGIRREEIEAWYTERLAGVSAATANRELARLKHCLGRAVAWGYLRANPAGPLRRMKEAPGRVRYLTPEERHTLLNGAEVTVKAKDGRTWTGHRAPSPALRLYILGALQTGARRSELLGLRWVDVDMRMRTVTFRRTKNGDNRTVPMADTLRETLQGLRGPSTPRRACSPSVTPRCCPGPSHASLRTSSCRASASTTSVTTRRAR